MDDELLFALLILAPLAVLIMSVLGLAAFIRTRSQQDEIYHLREALKEHRVQLDQLDAQFKGVVGIAPVSEEVAAQTAKASSDIQSHNEPYNHSNNPSTDSDNKPSSEVRISNRFSRLKDNIRHNWMVWLGGTCVGLAGVFMVAYSIEQGLLGPEARVVLSLLAGLGLHGLAERLQRTKGQSSVFAALAGGASIILYAALFASFKLFPSISPLIIFIAMALVSFGTMVLALRQGPILAALGILGGYVVPILIHTGSGDVELVLVYSAILTLFSLWLISYIERRWLWIGVITGSLFWWLASLLADPMAGARAFYLLVIAYRFLAMPRFDWSLQQIDWRAGEKHQHSLKNLVGWFKNLKDASLRRDQIKQLRQSAGWFQGILLLLVIMAHSYSLLL